MIPLPHDFSEFLRLLNLTGARYLLIGGYAVNYHGFSRPTGDMDIWIECNAGNAERVATALREFGFSGTQAGVFELPNQIIRMGVPPMRLEILTSVSGVEFEDCYSRRSIVEVDGCAIPVIGLEDLKTNKRASGRNKDLADIDQLPRDPG
jgi:hypothetical protein